MCAQHHYRQACFDRKEMMFETHDSKCMSAGHAGNFVQRHRAVGVEGCERMATFVICSEALDSLFNVRATSFRPHNDAVLCESTHLVEPIMTRNCAHLRPFQVPQSNSLC